MPAINLFFFKNEKFNVNLSWGFGKNHTFFLLKNLKNRKKCCFSGGMLDARTPIIFIQFINVHLELPSVIFNSIAHFNDPQFFKNVIFRSIFSKS